MLTHSGLLYVKKFGNQSLYPYFLCGYFLRDGWQYMDPFTQMCRYWMTNKNLSITALYGHRI